MKIFNIDYFKSGWLWLLRGFNWILHNAHYRIIISDQPKIPVCGLQWLGGTNQPSLSSSVCKIPRAKLPYSWVMYFLLCTDQISHHYNAEWAMLQQKKDLDEDVNSLKLWFALKTSLIYTEIYSSMTLPLQLPVRAITPPLQKRWNCFFQC